MKLPLNPWRIDLSLIELAGVFAGLEDPETGDQSSWGPGSEEW
jgi:hypothetical protein